MAKEVKTISGLLRHAKSSTTLDLYSHLTCIHKRCTRGGNVEKGMGCNPLRHLVRHLLFWVGVGQSTIMRVAAVVPLTSAIGVPTPTAS